MEDEWDRYFFICKKCSKMNYPKINSLLSEGTRKKIAAGKRKEDHFLFKS